MIQANRQAYRDGKPVLSRAGRWVPAEGFGQPVLMGEASRVPARRLGFERRDCGLQVQMREAQAFQARPNLGRCQPMGRGQSTGK